MVCEEEEPIMWDADKRSNSSEDLQFQEQMG